MNFRLNVNRLILKYRDIFYYLALAKSLNGCTSVLDIGCGSHSPLASIPKRYYSEGVDIFKPNILESAKHKIHNKYRHGDIKQINKYYKSKSFDAVIALDVIEHLPKVAALNLIHNMEKIAKSKVIILTPNGYYCQHPIEGNPYQEHRSGWTVSELHNLGYKIFGLRGLKYLRKEFTTLKYKPWLFWAIIAFISEPIFIFFPTLSYHIFAVKRIH